MRRLAAAVLAFALSLQSAPPPFRATWQRPGVARLAWSVPGGVVETCLIKEPARGSSVLIGCWYDLPAGPTGLSLGAQGPIDGSFRPTAGDVFVLTQDNQTVARAELRGVVYVALPVIMR